MKEENNFFHLEFFLTLLLLYLVIFLLGEIVIDYRPYISLGIISGFGFSWFNQRREGFLRKILINLGVLSAFLGLIYQIAHSSFLYDEVILIGIKGALIIEVILSFGAYTPSYLTYIQVLSIPLFMYFPIFIRGYGQLPAILIFGYIIIWLAVIKLKFYQFFKPAIEKNFSRYYSVYLLAIFFVISIFIAGVIFSNLSFLSGVSKGALLTGEGVEEKKGGFRTLESDYYDLQDKVQEEILKLIPTFKTTQEKYEILKFLSALLKESPYVQEVAKAEQGLIDYLNRPGPGLEKRNGHGATFLIKSYIDKKTLFNLKKIKDNITDISKRSFFNIKQKISILTRLNNMRQSNSYQDMQKYNNELQKIINRSSANTKAKLNLNELIRRLEEWKAFEIYRKSPANLNKADSNAEMPKDALAPETKPPQLSAEYSKTNSLADDNINVPIAKRWLAPAIIKAMIFLTLGIIAIFLTLYFLAEKEKNKLRDVFKKNPRAFIVGIYENTKEILAIFGLAYRKVSPPLFYARLVEERYLSENNLFLKLTVKFEEAKYSRHILRSEDALLALSDYHNFLKILFNRSNKFSLFLKYCRILLQRRPLFISKI